MSQATKGHQMETWEEWWASLEPERRRNIGCSVCGTHPGIDHNHDTVAPLMSQATRGT